MAQEEITQDKTSNVKSRAKGFTPLMIVLGIAVVLVGFAIGTYYLNRSKQNSQLAKTTLDICLSNKDTILGVVANFESLQQKTDAKGVLQLLTPPQAPSEMETYTNLSGSDNGNLPRLYGTATLNIKVVSYKVTEQPTRVNGDSCSVVVEETRSIYGGQSNPAKNIPDQTNAYKLTLTQKDNNWMIDQYQSEDAKIKPGKYSGWVMELANADQTNWKTYANTHAKVSFQYPTDWTVKEASNEEYTRISIVGKEGTIEIDYGGGFGGACLSGYENFKIGNAETQACHTTPDDGSEKWDLSNMKKDNVNVNNINYEGFITVNSPYKDNRDLILKIISTLEFTQ